VHSLVKLKFFILFITLFFIFKNGNAQSFLDLPKAEKMWVIKHPIAALKARKITRNTLTRTDSLKQKETLDTFFFGGKLDAFRHIFWMYHLTNRIGERKAKSLGIAHENGSLQQFKHKQLEDGLRPDSLSSVMDLYNNDLGIALAKNAPFNNLELVKNIFGLIQNGEAMMLKRNGFNFVNCNDEIVNISLYKTKWFIPYCLIKTNGVTY
jgi:hypothetical protein